MIESGAEVDDLLCAVLNPPDFFVDLEWAIFLCELLVEWWVDLCVVEVDADMFLMFEDVVDVFIMELFL